MKKILGLLMSVAIFACFMVGCANTTYQAIKAQDVDDEYYGFIVGKNHAKHDEILAAMNKVIAELKKDDDGDGNDKIADLIVYHGKLSIDSTASSAGESPVEIPDLSGMTGGTLRVYTNAAFAPYEYKKGGEIVGVDMDIMKLVAKELNMKVSFTSVDFESIVASVSLGVVADIGAAGISINDERKEKVDFSESYAKSIQYIICKEGTDYSKISDLKGLRIGVQLGTTGHLYCKGEAEDGSLKDASTKVVGFDDANGAFLGLKNNQVDVVVIDEKPAQTLVAKNNK